MEVSWEGCCFELHGIVLDPRRNDTDPTRYISTTILHLQNDASRRSVDGQTG
jgi:hypothetical protein